MGGSKGQGVPMPPVSIPLPLCRCPNSTLAKNYLSAIICIDGCPCPCPRFAPSLTSLDPPMLDEWLFHSCDIAVASAWSTRFLRSITHCMRIGFRPSSTCVRAVARRTVWRWWCRRLNYIICQWSACFCCCNSYRWPIDADDASKRSVTLLIRRVNVIN